MEETKKVNTSSGITFWRVVTLILITLKLTNYIDWSWWLIFSPYLFDVALGILILALNAFVGWVRNR